MPPISAGQSSNGSPTSTTLCHISLGNTPFASRACPPPKSARSNMRLTVVSIMDDDSGMGHSREVTGHIVRQIVRV